MLLKNFIICLLISISTFKAFGQACYESIIKSPSPFMGNNGEVFKLSDGSLWEVKYEYEYLYEYYPNVIICPSRGKLIIKGKNLNVHLVGGAPAKGNMSSSSSSDIIETTIDGEFQGWDGETIFKFTNGQIWQQSSYAYTYTYKYGPRAIIFKTTRGYELQVEGMDSRISIKRLK